MKHLISLLAFLAICLVLIACSKSNEDDMSGNPGGGGNHPEVFDHEPTHRDRPVVRSTRRPGRRPGAGTAAAGPTPAHRWKRVDTHRSHSRDSGAAATRQAGGTTGLRGDRPRSGSERCWPDIRLSLPVLGRRNTSWSGKSRITPRRSRLTYYQSQEAVSPRGPLHFAQPAEPSSGGVF